MINRQLIIMEASKKARELINKHSNSVTGVVGDIVPFTPINIPAAMINGYQIGRETGHPIAGTLLGREAAIGAMSKHDKNISIGDVYTGANMRNKLIGGAIPGIIAGTALAGPLGAMVGAASGAAIGAAAPAIRYGVGKVFGSSKPNKPEKIENPI